jgi:hypothetical protein
MIFLLSRASLALLGFARGDGVIRPNFIAL